MVATPEELIEEILPRLPVKSLLRFKTTSKKWYSLISEDHKFHMKQLSSSAFKNLILYQMDWSRDGAVFRYSDIDTSESRKFIFPVEISEIGHLIGSANGLICLGPSFGVMDSCFIWNPCTGEYKSISLPSPISLESCTSLFGFGYDSISDDYIIIGECNDSRLQMFSLKTNSWKMLDFTIKHPPLVYGFYLNGALHWCDTFGRTTHIAAFDFAKETVYFLELPEEMKLLSWLGLFEYQGSLCICHGKSIWVMREYGNSKSWAKLSTPLPQDSVPMGISRLGEVAYRTIDSGLGFVKSDSQGRMADEDKAQTHDFSNAFVYNESLISPKCFDPRG